MRLRRCTVLVPLVTALALPACSGSGDAPSTSSATSSTTSSASPTSHSSTPATGPSHNKPQAAPINPLTGYKPNNHGVIAVKIDDTSGGRPQRNIDQADNVYIEQVEAGLTRLLAVYNTTLPTVEAVRSTRASDPELVAPYGKIAYAASGGAGNPLHVLYESDLKAAIADKSDPGFSRDSSRYAPYNLEANLAQIATGLKSPKARSVGYHWSYDTDQVMAGPPGVHVRTTVGSTPVAFDWDSKLKRYVRLINGERQYTADGKPITATNVIVQFCKVDPYYQDIDVNGNASKYTHTMGTGKVVLFRNAHRITGTWKRKYYNGAWTFQTRHGKTMLLRPGNVWTVLVANGTALS